MTKKMKIELKKVDIDKILLFRNTKTSTISILDNRDGLISPEREPEIDDVTLEEAIQLRDDLEKFIEFNKERLK